MKRRWFGAAPPRAGSGSGRATRVPGSSLLVRTARFGSRLLGLQVALDVLLPGAGELLVQQRVAHHVAFGVVVVAGGTWRSVAVAFGVVVVAGRAALAAVAFDVVVVAGARASLAVALDIVVASGPGRPWPWPSTSSSPAARGVPCRRGPRHRHRRRPRGACRRGPRCRRRRRRPGACRHGLRVVVIGRAVLAAVAFGVVIVAGGAVLAAMALDVVVAGRAGLPPWPSTSSSPAARGFAPPWLWPSTSSSTAAAAAAACTVGIERPVLLRHHRLPIGTRIRLVPDEPGHLALRGCRPSSASGDAGSVAKATFFDGLRAQRRVTGRIG